MWASVVYRLGGVGRCCLRGRWCGQVLCTGQVMWTDVVYGSGRVGRCCVQVGLNISSGTFLTSTDSDPLDHGYVTNTKLGG